MAPPRDFATDTLDHHPRGSDVAAILGAAIRAVEPAAAVLRHLRVEDNFLIVGADRYNLASFDRVLIVAVGKAAAPMAQAALGVLEAWMVEGIVVPKATPGAQRGALGALEVLPASHPVPDERSVTAGRRVLNLLEGAGERDLVLVLLSGGGSALLTWPEAGLTLDDMRALTDALLASGATINEINALRRRCDRVKGGGLARAAYPATVAVLLLSDVVGDDLAAIASGPFVADAVDNVDAWDVVERYRLQPRLPSSILDLLRSPAPALPPETFQRVRHTIVANVQAAAEGAIQEAAARGLHTRLLSTALRGEARAVGEDLARQLVAAGEEARPLLWLAGGETTVTLRGDGHGGRNQELALAAVDVLAGRPDLLLVALATDGDDGPTDAAGAVVSGDTLQRGRARGLEPRHALARNDAYHYFEPLGDLLKPGPTETNVNDLVLLFAF